MRALLITALVSSSALAAEQPLAFTLTGPTVESGARELRVTLTPHFGRPEPFTRVEGELGVGFGVTPTLEAQLLLAIAIEAVGVDDRSLEGAIATRWRWQPLDGHRDLLGFGLTGTVAVSVDSVFFEGRVSGEKWLGDFLFALNASVDYRVRKGSSSLPALHLEQSGGIVYRLANNFTSGFEVRNRLGFADGGYYGDAIYAGPVFGLRAHAWWFSLGALAQVAAVKATALYGNGEPLELRDNERWVVRLQLGFETP